MVEKDKNAGIMMGQQPAHRFDIAPLTIIDTER